MMACPSQAGVMGPLRLRLFLMVTIITFMAAVVHPAPNKPIKLYASCTTTLLPKRCSFLVSALSKGLDETKALIAGPQLAAGKLKSDSCISKCSQVVSKMSQLVLDVATSYTTYKEAEDGQNAIANLIDYVTIDDAMATTNPCHCNCSEPDCSADEAAAVKKLGVVSRAIYDTASLLGTLFDKVTPGEMAATMEKSMDSGVLHVTCGLMKEPQKCVDRLTVLEKTRDEAVDLLWGLHHNKTAQLRPKVHWIISHCHTTIENNCNLELENAKWVPENPAVIGRDIYCFMKVSCNWGCDPPPEKPCSADEVAADNMIRGVFHAMQAIEKFLAELQPLPEVTGTVKEIPKDDL